MGLDMYCRKICKVPEEEIALGRFENKMPTFFPNLIAFTEADLEDEKECIADIMPFLTKVNMVASRVNYDLIKKMHDIPEDAELTGFSHNASENEIIFRKEEKKYELSFTEAEWYTFIEYSIIPTYIAYEEYCGYWRKEYSLEDALYTEYQAQDTLIHKVIDYLKHSSHLESWRQAFGIGNHIEGLDIDTTASTIVKEMKNNHLPEDNELEQELPLPTTSKEATYEEVKTILEDIKEFGLDYMQNRQGVIYNCGYHIMNKKMAMLAGKDLEYDLLDRTTETLIYKEWY